MSGYARRNESMIWLMVVLVLMSIAIAHFTITKSLCPLDVMELCAPRIVSLQFTAA
jgi:hypothetical protein